MDEMPALWKQVVAKENKKIMRNDIERPSGRSFCVEMGMT